MKAILLNWFEFNYELISKKNLISPHGSEVAILPVLYITFKFAFPVFLKKIVDADESIEMKRITLCSTTLLKIFLFGAICECKQN
jgi:hypothetical protein